jgi:hypothetical protein
MVNTAQQIGGSLGTALLNTAAAGATAGYLALHTLAPRAAGLVYGFSVATAWGVAILLLGAVAAALLINAPRPNPVRDRGDVLHGA